MGSKPKAPKKQDKQPSCIELIQGLKEGEKHGQGAPAGRKVTFHQRTVVMETKAQEPAPTL